MSDATPHTKTRSGLRDERLQPWIAAICSALLHLLFFFLLVWSDKPVLAPSQSAAGGGGRVKVDFVGQARRTSPRPPAPPTHAAASQHRRPHKPVQATLVAQADDPVPPDAPADDPADLSQPAPPSPDEAQAQQQTQAPAADPPTPPQRRSTTWGQPPGLLPRETAPENLGPGSGAASSQSYTNGPGGPEPNVGVGGYQIYYDPFGEARLRNWRDQGMTEVSFPLPGIREYMVCPLEIVLRRGSGGCRLLDPYDPQMKTIGDAREVVNVVRVYRRGELVWHGPEPYR